MQNIYKKHNIGEIYHVLNRGVDKRKLFLDRQDYLRFIHDLFVFNDSDKATNSYRTFKTLETMCDFASRSFNQPRNLIVDILCFVLMPNHYHLLLIPKVEEGISLFMRKVDMGYCKYFNRKYQRKGALFEGRYKSILVTDESHFIHLPYYIHCNPLDLIQPEWREGKLTNYKKAIQFLNNYRWSSYLDYIGKKNFPSVINRKFLLDFFEDEQNYYQDMYNWLKTLESEKRDLLSEFISYERH